MKNWLKSVLGFLLYIALVLLLVFVFNHYVTGGAMVEGPSMNPTLEDGDRLVLNKLSYRFDQLDRYDVIVFKYAYDTDSYYVKRVIGVPGQTVSYHQDQLYIDGEPIEEPYLDEGKLLVSYSGEFTWDFTLQEICQFDPCDVIPEGYYLVLGDNRPHSKDSRHIGLISEDQILGKATWIQWPLSSFGRIE